MSRLLGWICVLVLVYLAFAYSHKKHNKAHLLLGFSLVILAVFHGKLAGIKPDVFAMAIFLMLMLMLLFLLTKKKCSYVFYKSHRIFGIILILLTLCHVIYQLVF